ncbi:glycosyl hydrolase family 8 [Mariniflexile ostreae]|uniref:cellulase n=1 Tax=Mariniflexile ostreae TaxID=1520892 RepID=A0ABV5F6P3_9FLAO
MRTINLSIIFIIASVNFNYAQTLLNPGYEYGTLPTNINQSDIIEAYTSWKSKYTTHCNANSIRVKFDNPNETVSEGIGYGMLIAAYAGDQTLLDGLWHYYQSFLNENDVMHWKIQECSSVIGQNGATDAELDVAMALLIANTRWGSTGSINYSNAASTLINIIKTHEIESGTHVLKPGDAWGGSATTNISYYSPAYYRAYASHTNDGSWNNVASKSYQIIQLNQSQNNAKFNLVSDWCQADGSFSTQVGWAKYAGQAYSYDAARTPWRLTLDYLWYGNSDALSYANKAIAFINDKGGLDNIYPGYNLDGTAYEMGYKDVTFTGAYAVAAMASNNQDFVNLAYSKVVNMKSDAYFASTLRVLYLLTLSGNFYSPEKMLTLGAPQSNRVIYASFYPHPVINTLYLNFGSHYNNVVKLYNLSGTLLMDKACPENVTQIELQHLNSGLYIIVINGVPYKLLKE